jgi:hypothetical protein
MRSLTAAGLALGLGAGVAVTQQAHRAPLSPWWDGRVAGTRLRRSDMPVGGTVALLVAGRLRGTGRRRVSAFVTGLGLGAAFGAVGTGLLDPLPAGG